MIFLHDSLNSEKFKNDRKLLMLKKGVITPVQFINIIDKNDDYIMFGPAIIDKEKISEFISEWKSHKLNGDSILLKKMNSLTLDEIIEKLNKVKEIYPEINDDLIMYYDEIKNSICPKCTKNNHITSIITKIKKIIDSGDLRDNLEYSDFINTLIEKYSGHYKSIDEVEVNDFDVEWIKPETMNGLGNDIIEKLENCFECVIKHIGRAKILYEEFITGYPNHSEISFNELLKGNKALEELCLKYMDSCSQMDMGSCELVGDIVNLPNSYITEIIDLANEIRKQRLLFQENVDNVPNFDELRIMVKKLEIKIQSNEIE